MAVYEPKRLFQIGPGISQVQRSRRLGRVGPSAKLSHALGREFMGSPVKAVSANAYFLPLGGHGVVLPRLVGPLVERRLKQYDFSRRRQNVADPDAYRARCH